MYHKIFLNISDVCTLLKRLTTSWSCLASLLVCCNCYLELSFLFLVSSHSLLPYTFPLHFLTQGAQGLTTLYNHICCLKVRVYWVIKYSKVLTVREQHVWQGYSSAWALLFVQKGPLTLTGTTTNPMFFIACF